MIKRWFPFNFAKTLLGRHFVVGGPKNFKRAQIFDSLKIQNVSNLFFRKRSHQKIFHFIFLKGRYFAMGGSIEMNFGVL